LRKGSLILSRNFEDEFLSWKLRAVAECLENLAELMKYGNISVENAALALKGRHATKKSAVIWSEDVIDAAMQQIQAKLANKAINMTSSTSSYEDSRYDQFLKPIESQTVGQQFLRTSVSQPPLESISPSSLAHLTLFTPSKPYNSPNIPNTILRHSSSSSSVSISSTSSNSSQGTGSGHFHSASLLHSNHSKGQSTTSTPMDTTSVMLSSVSISPSMPHQVPSPTLLAKHGLVLSSSSSSSSSSSISTSSTSSGPQLVPLKSQTLSSFPNSNINGSIAPLSPSPMLSPYTGPTNLHPHFIIPTTMPTPSSSPSFHPASPHHTLLQSSTNHQVNNNRGGEGGVMLSSPTVSGYGTTHLQLSQTSQPYLLSRVPNVGLAATGAPYSSSPTITKSTNSPLGKSTTPTSTPVTSYSQLEFKHPISVANNLLDLEYASSVSLTWTSSPLPEPPSQPLKDVTSVSSHKSIVEAILARSNGEGGLIYTIRQLQLIENDFLKTRFENFHAALSQRWKTFKNVSSFGEKLEIETVCHGSSMDSAHSISRVGFLKGKIRRELYGAGHYFASKPHVASGYTKDYTILICDVVVGAREYLNSDNASSHKGYILVRFDEAIWPRYILTFDAKLR
jgi:hypothetical protein